ncbi:hypothetical protein R6Q59_004125 [Mikania micrantha]
MPPMLRADHVDRLHKEKKKKKRTLPRDTSTYQLLKLELKCYDWHHNLLDLGDLQRSA